jgi:hypothetical protein
MAYIGSSETSGNSAVIYYDIVGLGSSGNYLGLGVYGGWNKILKINNNGLVSINKTGQAETNLDIAGGMSVFGLITLEAIWEQQHDNNVRQ